MKLEQKIEFQRPDQIMEVYKGEHNMFFLYYYRGMDVAVFTDPHDATEYAKSPLAYDGDPDYYITIDDERVQEVPSDKRQQKLTDLALTWCDQNDVNNNLINPHN